jgi:hypothetical protein
MKQYSSTVNRLLTIFFAILLAGQVIYLLIGFASNLRYYQRVTDRSMPTVVVYGEVQLSNEGVSQMAADRGLSLEQYALYHIILSSVAAVIPLAVAAVIAWRARWLWFAWFTAFIIVFLGASALDNQTLAAQFISLGVFGANYLFWFLVLLYLFLFPTGTAVPRRAGWVVGALVIYHLFIQTGTVIAYAAPDLAVRLRLPNWGEGVNDVPILLNFLIILACQFYRYRRVSSPVERQQTKWFLFGFGFIVATIPLAIVLDVSKGHVFLKDITDNFLWLPLYLSLAVAVLRYRLFDIDVIIRKTLIYGALTGLLALVYFGSVVLLQGLFEAFTGQSPPIVIVISTLLIAALFAPLRRRLQRTIDRRFFRRKYNAQRVLAQFAESARSQVELEALTAEIVRVVQETMQPVSVGISLKSSKQPAPVVGVRRSRQ